MFILIAATAVAVSTAEIIAYISIGVVSGGSVVAGIMGGVYYLTPKTSEIDVHTVTAKQEEGNHLAQHTSEAVDSIINQSTQHQDQLESQNQQLNQQITTLAHSSQALAQLATNVQQTAETQVISQFQSIIADYSSALRTSQQLHIKLMDEIRRLVDKNQELTASINESNTHNTPLRRVGLFSA
jgi:ABC-type transporter Mla subunit MlaD